MIAVEARRLDTRSSVLRMLDADSEDVVNELTATVEAVMVEIPNELTVNVEPISVET
jgi:hypothetical protein